MFNKRGQVTIFIIIALVIVVIGILIYLFWPKLNISSEFDAKNPELFIKSCVKDDLEDAVNLVSAQGGSIEPDFYYLYEDERLEYLCYTPEYSTVCAIQQPFLRSHIEEELTSYIEPYVSDCFDNLVEKYKDKGYSVQLEKGDVNTTLLPERIQSVFQGYKLTAKKGNNAEIHQSFSVVLNNNLYQLANSISTNIIEWEAIFGDADNLGYMIINTQEGLKVYKLKQTDGTTVYKLEDKSGSKFQFASRSLVAPPGY
ncbi:MAG: hypothetical protein KC516_03430 [Nanoarchaeota archaeon]|nr:hypothetical protein [Nanoarchaeota archaeon]